MKYVLILLVLAGCKSEPTVLQEVTFNVGFESSGRFSGVFTDSLINKQVIVFGDAVTNQKLRFFETNGKFIKDVDLSNQAKDLGSIDYIWLSSMDSINLLSPSLKKIVSINSSGEKINELNLQNLIYNNGDIYNYTAAAEPSLNMVLKGRTYLRSEWRENINSSENGSTAHSIKHYFENYNNAVNIMSIVKMKDGNLKKEVLVSGFYKNLSKVVKAFPEGAPYAIVNGKLLLTSFYSNKIFIFSLENGKLVKTVEVNSEFTKFNTDGFTLDNNSIENLQTLVTEGELAGFVGNIFFDEENDLYFVMVAHSVLSQKNKYNRNFSIIKFDKDFKQLDEIYFDNKKFNAFSAMMIDNKIWLEEKTTSPKIKKYAVLDL